jgi:signal transduction histidine kinase
VDPSAHLSDSQRFLQRLIVSTINAQEVESNRVSRLLHDEVGQVLTAVGFMLHVLKLDYKTQPDLIERLTEIQTVLDKTVQQVRSLSYDLNPSIVERAGLQMALDRLIGRYREKFAGSIRYLYDSSVRVPLPVGNSWYKIAELALENSIRHASAGRIEVHVKRSQKDLTLEVRDNGKGFSPEEASQSPKGIGLLMMEHYSSQAPISVSLKSTPGKGTSVRSTYIPDPAESNQGQ